jgi:hypothetical protein
MNLSRKFELAGGLGAGLLGVIAPFTFRGVRTILLTDRYFETLLPILLFFILPGVLFAIGAYLHAARQKIYGRRMCLVLGGFYLLTAPTLFMTGRYAGGWSGAFLAVAPAGVAVTTLFVTSIAKRREAAALKRQQNQY